jgi:hypothetical protein
MALDVCVEVVRPHTTFEKFMYDNKMRCTQENRLSASQLIWKSKQDPIQSVYDNYDTYASRSYLNHSQTSGIFVMSKQNEKSTAHKRKEYLIKTDLYYIYKQIIKFSEELSEKRIDMAVNPVIDASYDKNGFTSYPWFNLSLPWREDVIGYLVRNAGLMMGTLNPPLSLENERDQIEKGRNILLLKGITPKQEPTYRLKRYIQKFTALVYDMDYTSGEHSYEEILERVKKLPFSAYLHTTKSYGTIKVGSTNPATSMRLIVPLGIPIIDDEQYPIVALNFIDAMAKHGFADPDIPAIKTRGRYWHPTGDGFLSYFHEAPLFYEPDISGYKKKSDPADAIREAFVTAGSRFHHSIKENTDPKDVTVEPSAFFRTMRVIMENGEDAVIEEIEVIDDEQVRVHCPFPCCTQRERANTTTNAILNYDELQQSYSIYCFSSSTLFIEGERTGLYNVRDLCKRSIFIFYERQTRAYYYYLPSDPTRQYWAKKEDLKQIFNSYGRIPHTIPNLTFTFDPTLDYQIDYSKQVFNTFVPSPYLTIEKEMKDADMTKSDIAELASIAYFPTISRLLENVIPNESEREAFLNYLSTIFHTRDKIPVAWVFKTRQGVGKNVFFEHVISPIFGSENCKLVDDASLQSDWTSFMKNASFVAFNEVQASNVKRNTVKNNIKMLVSDSVIVIHEKYVNDYYVDNHSNILIFTNEAIPLVIEQDDRRFNVVDATQSHNLAKAEWYTTYSDLISKIQSEIIHFALFLSLYPYDKHQASQVITNEAKTSIVDVSSDRYTLFAKALSDPEHGCSWILENIDFDHVIVEVMKDPELGSITHEDLPIMITNQLQKRKVANRLMIALFESIFDDETNPQRLYARLRVHGIRIVSEREGKHRFVSW